MSSFEMNRLQSITGVSPVPNADRAKGKAAADGNAPLSDPPAAGSAKSAGVAVEITAPVKNGPPIDADRVAEIRNALRDGTYPLVPAKIADAMIAAQLKFEIE